MAANVSLNSQHDAHACSLQIGFSTVASSTRVPPAQTMQGESRVVGIMAPSTALTELLLSEILFHELPVHQLMKRPVHPHLRHELERTVLVFCTWPSSTRDYVTRERPKGNACAQGSVHLRRQRACWPALAPCPYSEIWISLLPSLSIEEGELRSRSRALERTNSH